MFLPSFLFRDGAFVVPCVDWKGRGRSGKRYPLVRGSEARKNRGAWVSGYMFHALASSVSMFFVDDESKYVFRVSGFPPRGYDFQGLKDLIDDAVLH